MKNGDLGPTRIEPTGRILSQEESETIARRVFDIAEGGDETQVSIRSWWQGELRWARNRVSLASDRRDVRLSVTRGGTATTNQLDEVSLAGVVRAAERSGEVDLMPVSGYPPAIKPPIPRLDRPRTTIWSDATFGLLAEMRAGVTRRIIEPAEAQGMLSAGYLEVRAGSMASLNSLRKPGEYALVDTPYVTWTQAQCSMTVRDQKGTGSGWAGLSSYDWGKIDSGALAVRALEKALASRNPVALEPGRYTVILEQQAVADLMEIFANSIVRIKPETGPLGPWSLGRDQTLGLWRTKLGLKVADERITISYDPMDPELGILPAPGLGPVTWIDRGVLVNLAYGRDYALEKLNENVGVPDMAGYRMSGGKSSVDEMIESTKRGLLVTRFSNIRTLDGNSLLATGLTRDGLWLIENGKIAKAVKNFRFTESPLFVLNSIEQLGPPVPVFRPVKDPYSAGVTPAIVPPLKVRDFSFTSLIDAV